MDSLVWPNDDVAHTEDSPGSFKDLHQGQFGDLDIGGFVHELGHLMGFGDDYIRVPDDSERGWHPEPKPGREGTLMGPRSGGNQVITGRVGRIDQALIDRIGDMLTEAGQNLPECWTGTMHSETDFTYTVDNLGSCSNAWDTIFEVTVNEAGVVAGAGTATAAGPPKCSFPMLFSKLTEFPVQVQGQADDQQFELRFGGVQQGGIDWGGFGLTILDAGQAPVGPPLVIPKTDPCTAGGDVGLANEQLTVSGTSLNSVELTCSA